MIGAFFDVYFTLGFGFLEHVYSLALERGVVQQGGLVVRGEAFIPINKDDEVPRRKVVKIMVEEGVVEVNTSSEVFSPTKNRPTNNHRSSTHLEAVLIHYGGAEQYFRRVD